MCGVYWPCPETRAGDFSSRRCVCGRKSSRGSLTLHFCFGPCPCAVNSRAKWKQRVAEAFQRHGLSATAGGSTPTYALLARWLGNGGRGLGASGQFHILMGGVPKKGGACESMRLSPCVLVQPDGWARGEREGYGEPCDVTSLSLSLKYTYT